MNDIGMAGVTRPTFAMAKMNYIRRLLRYIGCLPDYYLFLGIMFIVLCTPVFAWDGYDYEKGSYIEIDSGNLVRSGQTIEIYDYNGGSYKDVEVESVDKSGSSVEIEVFDSDTGEYRTFEMENE